MNNFDLFGYPLYQGEPPHQKHSDTSRAAAAKIKPRIGPLHLEVIGYLTRHPDGATDERMQIELPMAPNTQRPRRIELTQWGRIRDSGRRELTRSRSFAVVWELVSQKPASNDEAKWDKMRRP